MSQVLKQLKTTTSAKTLFCFPFAGGYSASFRPLVSKLNPDWNVVAIEPPGHGTNRTPLVDDLEKLIDLYLEAMRPYLKEPFALFGHSMGGMIVYRVTQRLEAEGIFPEQVIISAINPPDQPRHVVSHYDNKEFLDYVTALGGIPEELLQHQELLDLVIPVLRSDFRAIDNFEHRDFRPVTSTTHLFAGTEDHRCNPENMQGWKTWIQNPQFHTFTGGHMFLMNQADDVARELQKILSSLAWS